MAKRKIQITTDNVEFLKLHKKLKSKLKTQALEEALFLAAQNEDFRKKYFEDFEDINVIEPKQSNNPKTSSKIQTNNSNSKIKKQWG